MGVQHPRHSQETFSRDDPDTLRHIRLSRWFNGNNAAARHRDIPAEGHPSPAVLKDQHITSLNDHIRLHNHRLSRLTIVENNLWHDYNKTGRNIC
jgi:hypothetical protein